MAGGTEETHKKTVWTVDVLAQIQTGTSSIRVISDTAYQIRDCNSTLQEWGCDFAPCHTNIAPVAVFSSTSDTLLRRWRTEQGTSTRTPSCSSSPRLMYNRQVPICKTIQIKSNWNQNSWFHLVRRASTVRIATGYRLDGRGVKVQVPVWSRIFSFPRHPGWLWGPPSVLSDGYQELFPSE
jgi:hypothetical protein